MFINRSTLNEFGRYFGLIGFLLILTCRLGFAANIFDCARGNENGDGVDFQSVLSQVIADPKLLLVTDEERGNKNNVLHYAALFGASPQGNYTYYLTLFMLQGAEI